MSYLILGTLFSVTSDGLEVIVVILIILVILVWLRSFFFFKKNHKYSEIFSIKGLLHSLIKMYA